MRPTLSAVIFRGGCWPAENGVQWDYHGIDLGIVYREDMTIDMSYIQQLLLDRNWIYDSYDIVLGYHMIYDSLPWSKTTGGSARDTWASFGSGLITVRIQV